MNSLRFIPTNFFRIITTIALALVVTAAAAHEFSAGDVHIKHPYATPTPAGASIGAAYFAGLENRGAQADRLVRVTSAVSQRVELHSGEVGADGVMRMRELDGIPIAPHTSLQLRPGHGNHLMLIDLKKPLVEGDMFTMTLEFERAGKVEVKVMVQAAEAGGKNGAAAHKH